MSFQKIFGYPELGALLIRRNQSWSQHSQHHMGETAVTSVGEVLHITNNILSHNEFEEGRVDIQSVLDLGHAIDVHRELYGPDPMEAISRRTTSLTRTLVRKLQELVHGNGEPVVRIYKSNTPHCWDSSTHGPMVAINVTRADGSFVDCRAVQEAAASRKICVANLALWDYDSVATNRQWDIARIEPARWLHSDQEMVVSGLPTGVVRVSLGAMSTEVDILIFVNFISASYIQRHDPAAETILRKVETWRMNVVAARSAT
jgi:molybdenum cofactor sulfurtransferase